MKKPKIENELKYISDFLMQSYPDAIDKNLHEEARDVFEQIKESHLDMIDVLILCHEVLLLALIWDFDSAPKDRMDDFEKAKESIEQALTKAGIEL